MIYLIQRPKIILITDFVSLATIIKKNYVKLILKKKQLILSLIKWSSGFTKQ